ncbi:MBOAT family O-acyltransferase [Chloroflexota bacterium]
MTLTHILVFTALAFLIGWLLPARWRTWALMGASLLAVYWLQPSTPIRYLDFWLPSASIFLTVFVWTATRSQTDERQQATLITPLVVVGIIVALGLTRYIEPLCCLTPTRPPDILRIGITIIGAGLAILAARMLNGKWKYLPGFGISFILLLFIIIKSGPLAQNASAWLRTRSGQTADLASALDIPWLGFSYLAFRLLHILRDHQAGKLPSYRLDEFITYTLFFSTFTAGPIDRSQHFVSDLRQLQEAAPVSAQRNLRSLFLNIDYPRVLLGGRRILLGIFKKFVLADSLAIFALNTQNASQVNGSAWLWLMLYAYALRIYFDFCGYSDIAIGLGNLVGIKLPENFERPYLKVNLTTFWNSWHMTLAQWFRAYLFNPLTRALRGRPQKLPAWFIILAGQIITMLLIGLWHGITWNFAIWGLWHGLGLFIHNRWTAWSRTRMAARQSGISKRSNARLQIISQTGGWFLTFHYVLLGWVWFALPSPALAWEVFGKLLGI